MLYNYSRKCIYEKKWNKITLNARGHVYEVGTNKLVAMAFQKFFNLMELPEYKRKDILKQKDYTCYEKIDGSLGIIYHYAGTWRVNTRGSFSSEQAEEALKMIEKIDMTLIPTKLTILVEIIYPNNKIIIDYGNRKELVILTIFNRDTKKELSRSKIKEINQNLGLSIVKSYDNTFEKMFEFQKSKVLTTEGFVVHFKNGERIKIKSKRYLEIARILANLTPLSVWKCMEMGKVKQKTLEEIPEEFRQDLDGMVNDLESKYSSLKGKIEKEYEKVMKKNPSRAEIAQNKTIKYKSAIFSLLDGKYDRVDSFIMKLIRPSNE